MKDLLLTLRTFERIGNIENLHSEKDHTTGILHLKEYKIEFYIAFKKEYKYNPKEHFYISLRYEKEYSQIEITKSYFTNDGNLNKHNIFTSEINKFIELIKNYNIIN